MLPPALWMVHAAASAEKFWIADRYFLWRAMFRQAYCHTQAAEGFTSRTSPQSMQHGTQNGHTRAIVVDSNCQTCVSHLTLGGKRSWRSPSSGRTFPTPLGRQTTRQPKHRNGSRTQDERAGAIMQVLCSPSRAAHSASEHRIGCLGFGQDFWGD